VANIDTVIIYRNILTLELVGLKLPWYCFITLIPGLWWTLMEDDEDEVEDDLRTFWASKLASNFTSSGANVIELFTAVIYECSKQPRVFVLEGIFSLF
jgi:hypothetical protein